MTTVELASINARTIARWRGKAAEWRKGYPELSGGFITIFRGKVTGWFRSLEHAPAKNFEPCLIAVPADESAPCLITMGGTASNGADRWTEVVP